MIDSNQTMSFDRMRSMLVRAAEVRDSEQQQIFDSLDEIHGRLQALDALGAIRKRLADVPDRTEMSVLAERLDETVAKLDAQESAIASLARAVDGLVDRIGERLSTPFAQLDGRLDGVAGRFEGVAGRMDGLEDRIAGLHKRLDDLDGRFDRHETRLDGMPSSVGGPIREKLDAVESGLRDELDEARRALTDDLAGSRQDARTDSSAARTRSDEAFADLTGRLDALSQRLDGLGGRVDGVEAGMGERVTALSTSIENSLDKLDGTLVNRPDHEAVVALVRQANDESERRNAGNLDEALSTFAEIILGSGNVGQVASTPPPRPAARRSARKPATREYALNGNGSSGDAHDEDEHAES